MSGMSGAGRMFKDIKDAVTKHQSKQWYVDEHVIDCDANVVESVLRGVPIK